MSGKTIFEGTIISSGRFSSFGNSMSYYKNCPQLSSTKEIEESIARKELDYFLVNIDVLNEFLNSKFNTDLLGLMQQYCKKHFSELGMQATDIEIEYLVKMHSIPDQIVTCLKTADTLDDIKNELEKSNTLISDAFGNTQLNLHTDDLRKFTLIHANCDIDAEKTRFFYGYPFNCNNLKYFIKSSAQMDLTIITC